MEKANLIQNMNTLSPFVLFYLFPFSLVISLFIFNISVPSCISGCSCWSCSVGCCTPYDAAVDAGGAVAVAAPVYY